MKSRYIFSLNIPSIYLLRNKSKKKSGFNSARLWVYLSLWFYRNFLFYAQLTNSLIGGFVYPILTISCQYMEQVNFRN